MAQETSGLRSGRNIETDTKTDEGDSLYFNVGNEAPNEISDETEQIKAQIEETRSNMGQTIDAIQERLSISNISGQVSEQVSNAIETAKDTVYEATFGKAVNFMKETGNSVKGSSVVRSLSANPWPYALIGIGGAWLIYNNTGNRRSYGSDDPRYRTKKYLTTNEGEDKRSSGMMRNSVESVSGAAGQAYDSVASAADDAYESVASGASDTYRRATGVANRAYEKAGDLGYKAKETYEHYVKEKPLAVAAAVGAVGVAIGFALPTTRYEGELMGESRDHLMSTAGDTANELVDKAKQVANEAGRAIKAEIDSGSESTNA